jgi:hypothetical protein
MSRPAFPWRIAIGLVALALPLSACRGGPAPAAAPPSLSIEAPSPWIIDPPGRGIPR